MERTRAFWMRLEKGTEQVESTMQFKNIPSADCVEELTEFCYNLHPSMAASGKVGGSSRDIAPGDKTVGLADKPLLIQALVYVEAVDRLRKLSTIGAESNDIAEVKAMLDNYVSREKMSEIGFFL